MLNNALIPQSSLYQLFCCQQAHPVSLGFAVIRNYTMFKNYTQFYNDITDQSWFLLGEIEDLNVDVTTDDDTEILILA